MPNDVPKCIYRTPSVIAREPMDQEIGDIQKEGKEIIARLQKIWDTKEKQRRTRPDDTPSRPDKVYKNDKPVRDYEELARDFEDSAKQDYTDCIKADERSFSMYSDKLISHWYSRMLPIKWLLRQLLGFSAIRGTEWVDLRDFVDYLQFEMLDNLEKTLSANDEVEVGFPKIDMKSSDIRSDDIYRDEKIMLEKHSARKHFLHYYLGKPFLSLRYRNKTSQLRKNEINSTERYKVRGACFEMGFVIAAGDTEGGFGITLTPLGLEFARMKNMRLDQLEQSNIPLDEHVPEMMRLVDEHDKKQTVPRKFSNEEIMFILNNIYRPQNKTMPNENAMTYRMYDYFEIENKIIAKILKKEGQALKKSAYHKLFDETAKSSGYPDRRLIHYRLVHQRSATILRLAELGLIYRGGRKGNEVYVVQPEPEPKHDWDAPYFEKTGIWRVRRKER